jgi:hypothetical protein
MDGWVPAACTLPTEQQPLRLAEFDELFRSALRRVERRGDTWLRLGLVDSGNTAERARELTGRESACCSFFRFDVRRAGRDIEVDVRVPTGREAVLDGLARQAAAALAGEGR